MAKGLTRALSRSLIKNITKGDVRNYIWLVILAVPLYWTIQQDESLDWFKLSVFVAAAILVIAIFNILKNVSREKSLMNKYQDQKIVEMIICKRVWQGQSAEQLVDSLGKPEDIDKKYLWTRKKEIWKYKKQGKDRFGLEITLANDVVIGWEVGE